MRVAVLADIHGNLPACEAVLEDIKRQAPDAIVAAGDLCLRGAWPKETFDLLHDACDALLMGNTDCYLAGNYLSGAYREKDHWKTDLLDWTRDQLGAEKTAALGQLAFSTRYSPRKGQDLFVCHANPRNLEDSLEPTLDDHTVRKLLGNLDATALAFGHLHFPYRRRLGRLVMADVASAGIPRDGDLRPAWGLFTWTPRGWRVQIRRVRYAVRRATSGLHERKVPGASLLVHKMLECRYRHHELMAQAARRHSGLPPYLKPPPGSPSSLKPVGAPQPVLPPPPGLEAPPPGQSTQADEAADDAIAHLKLPEPSVPAETEASSTEISGERLDPTAPDGVVAALESDHADEPHDDGPLADGTPDAGHR
ncbi:MAG: metallophosphoesterase [Myxococcaceae bacterium]|jgi:predicted phosphodiesterase|nr:metallophosphoesterase [Myxococcaceae bacterium]